MRARVDAKLCTGHGRCYELAPEIFSDDERGHCVITLASFPPELHQQAARAAGNCPEGAISLDVD